MLMKLDLDFINTDVTYWCKSRLFFRKISFYSIHDWRIDYNDKLV